MGNAYYSPIHSAVDALDYHFSVAFAVVQACPHEYAVVGVVHMSTFYLENVESSLT